MARGWTRGESTLAASIFLMSISDDINALRAIFGEENVEFMVEKRIVKLNNVEPNLAQSMNIDLKFSIEFRIPAQNYPSEQCPKILVSLPVKKACALTETRARTHFRTHFSFRSMPSG